MIGSSYQAAVEALPEITVAITDRQREDRSNGAEQRSFLAYRPIARFKFEACATPLRREQPIRPDHLADSTCTPEAHYAAVLSPEVPSETCGSGGTSGLRRWR